jgi:hypothetical protein
MYWPPEIRDDEEDSIESIWKQIQCRLQCGITWFGRSDGRSGVRVGKNQSRHSPTGTTPTSGDD